MSAVPLVCVLLVACGGAGRTGGSGSGGTKSTVAGKASGGLRGKAVTVSDVEGTSDYPVEKGFVAAVPIERVRELWVAGGVAPSPKEPQHASFALGRPAFEELGGAIATLDDDGSFVLAAPTGPHVLCLVVPTFAGRLEGVQGCAEATLPATGSLRLTTGEAGLQATVHSQ